VLVGFAAETGDLLRKAREKRARKNVDLIVANDVTTPGAGFEVETNAVTIIGADQEQTLPLQSKARVAEAILDRVEQLLKTRTAAVNS
jgi:phosphopantothenoylcysteine decarboxylase/phosphopantothenate--cysteine ligase